MNFDLKKYLAENKLTANSRLNEEAFDITKEVQLGDVLVDVQGDMYEVVAISPSQVELEPFNFKGDNSIFPDDFGNDVSIEDFWQHLTAREEEEPRGMFGEPWDSDYFGNHIRENKLTANSRLNENSISTSTLKKEIEEACDYLENTSDISQQTIDFIRKMGPQMVDFISKVPK